MTELVTIAPGHQLAPAAAAAYLRARAAGCPAGITSSARSRAEQESFYASWLAGEMPGTPSVAVPGTSRHERGTALDLPEPTRTWMRQHGHEYGWIAGIVPGEPWHFEYRASADQHLTDAAPAVPAPIAPLEDDDMATTGFITTYPGTAAMFVLAPDLATKRHLHSVGEVAVLKAGGAIEVAPGGITAKTIDRATWEPCCDVFQR